MGKYPIFQDKISNCISLKGHYNEQLTTGLNDKALNLKFDNNKKQLHQVWTKKEYWSLLLTCLHHNYMKVKFGLSVFVIFWEVSTTFYETENRKYQTIMIEAFQNGAAPPNFTGLKRSTRI